jgi:predicted HD superfamily hydrolase involved in NAD metabolism
LHQRIQNLTHEFKLTGDISQDVPAFLLLNGFPKTALHSGDVAVESRRVAKLVGADTHKAEIAGWLHDISVVFPNAERIAAARDLGLDVLPEEEAAPLIIHQKLSVVLSREVFGIKDENILSAIGCHTTLKANASLLDKVLFVADKLAWDQVGSAPFHDAMQKALGESIDRAALVYLEYLYGIRDRLKAFHPWALDAYHELITALNSGSNNGQG